MGSSSSFAYKPLISINHLTHPIAQLVNKYLQILSADIGGELDGGRDACAVLLADKMHDNTRSWSRWFFDGFWNAMIKLGTFWRWQERRHPEVCK